MCIWIGSQKARHICSSGGLLRSFPKGRLDIPRKKRFKCVGTGGHGQPLEDLTEVVERLKAIGAGSHGKGEEIRARFGGRRL